MIRIIPVNQLDKYLKKGYELIEKKIVTAKVQKSEYKDYPDAVVKMIREKYTVDDELSILRQKDIKAEQFTEYFNFVEECKRKARLIFPK